MGTRRPKIALVAAFGAVCGCAGADDSTGIDDGRCHETAPASRFASCVDAFTPGDGAGFGQESFPAVVFGAPKGGGSHAGSTDVLSLGKGGSIVVGFGANAVVDGPGPDLLVFENAFYIGDHPDKPFAEPGEVSVSDDGASWATFPCAKDQFPYEGCAGWHPVFAESDASALDPASAGGDAFDLADVGLAEVRFVRIVDVSDHGAEPNAGFDLDAVAVIHARVP